MNIILMNQGWLGGELKALGHNVITAGWIKDFFNLTIPWGSSADFLLQMAREHFEPDVLVYYDNSALPTVNNLEDLKIPKIFISVDTFHHLNWHAEYAKFFNLTLVAQKDYVLLLEEKAVTPIEVEWFPLWVNHYLEPVKEKTINVSFRGNLSETLHPERKAFFERVSKEVKVDYDQGPFAEIYTKSKIVLNQAVKNDVNFRVFEVLMSGALLLTPRTGNGLEDLLTDGENCVLYEPNNSIDAVEKLKFYLENDEERERIAGNGRELAINNHSAKATAIRLEQKLEKILSEDIKVSKTASFIIQTFMARSLWQLLRMDGDQKYIEPLEKSINSLIERIGALDSEVISDPSFETTIVISDLVCFDILDSTSYKCWFEELKKNLPEMPFVKLAEKAYSKEYDSQEAFDILRKVRYQLVQGILNIK